MIEKLPLNYTDLFFRSLNQDLQFVLKINLF